MNAWRIRLELQYERASFFRSPPRELQRAQMDPHRRVARRHFDRRIERPGDGAVLGPRDIQVDRQRPLRGAGDLMHPVEDRQARPVVLAAEGPGVPDRSPWERAELLARREA